MTNFTQKQYALFQKLAKTLQAKTDREIRDRLAQIEMREGESARKEIERELNMLAREAEYNRQAEDFYGDVKNVGQWPEDFKDFPEIKKEIFRRFYKKRRLQIERTHKKLKKNKELIKHLLLYRIKNKTDKFSPHLIPRELKGVSAEITMEAERLYYVYKSMFRHNQMHPTSLRFGMTAEEKDILKKIQIGYFDKKISKNENKERGQKGKRQSIKTTMNKIRDAKEKEHIKQLIKKPWYRKSELSNKEIDMLKRIGYQESDKPHPVYDFDSKLVACVGYKEGGFRTKSNYKDMRESLHHFSRPYLLKEISPSTQILVKIKDKNNNERIVDAVLSGENNNKPIKIAVEFQQSHKISKEEIEEKITPIVEKFDFLIIVSSEDYITQYEKFRSDKVFVVNNVGFKDILKQFGIIESPSGKK